MYRGDREILEETSDNAERPLTPTTITTTTRHVSVPASAYAASSTAAYTAAAPASIYSSLVIALITSPESVVNWRHFSNTKSICEIVDSRKRSSTEPTVTGATSSARTRSPSFSPITSKFSPISMWHYILPFLFVYGWIMNCLKQSQQNPFTQPQNGNTFYGLPLNLTQEQVDVQLLVS